MPQRADLLRRCGADPLVVSLLPDDPTWDVPDRFVAAVNYLVLGGEFDDYRAASDPWGSFRTILAERSEFVERFVRERPVEPAATTMRSRSSSKRSRRSIFPSMTDTACRRRSTAPERRGRWRGSRLRRPRSTALGGVQYPVELAIWPGGERRLLAQMANGGEWLEWWG